MVGIREGYQRPPCPSVRPTLTHQISRIVTRCPVLSGLSGSRGGTRLGLHMLCHPRPAQPGPVGPSPPPCVKPGLTGLTGRTGKTCPILSLLTKPDNIASTILPIICHHLPSSCPASHVRCVVLPRPSPPGFFHDPHREDRFFLNSNTPGSHFLVPVSRSIGRQDWIPRSPRLPSFLSLARDVGSLVLQTLPRHSGVFCPLAARF